MQAQHTDREKAVPMFNAFRRRVPDDISRWMAKVSENPIVEAFPEKIDIHPGYGQLFIAAHGNAEGAFRTRF